LNASNKKPWHYITLLILAGEAVFILPFVLARVFRATVLDVYTITNTEIGYCFSIYGLVALVSYLVGGPLADRVPPRKLMGIALIMTAAGGLVYANDPSLTVLKILYGYWGFTTIFLFWAGMIKATRVWGGNDSQGKAFGFLDGGRGLVGALFGLLGVFIFSLFVSDAAENLVATNSAEAFKSVVLVSSIIVSLIGVIVFFFLKIKSSNEKEILKEKITRQNIKEVLQLRSVWLLMIIILCAYVGYKITDIFSLYAKVVMGYTEVEAAKTGTFLLFIRPIVGVAVGFLADRSRASLYLCIGFALSIIGALLFASGYIASSNALFFTTIIITAVGVYAARVLYFAIMKEGRIPLALTGTAVGVISFIGYTPDIFAGPMIGYFLDGWKGEQGHAYLFYALAGFSVVGLLASLAYHSYFRSEKDT
jgi:sugar phosphate permease